MYVPRIHRHAGVGWSIFSQVRLALSTRSGAHSAPVWVTAHLGAEAGGMDVMEGVPLRANSGWVPGALHCPIRVQLVSPLEKWVVFMLRYRTPLALEGNL